MAKNTKNTETETETVKALAPGIVADLQAAARDLAAADDDTAIRAAQMTRFEWQVTASVKFGRTITTTTSKLRKALDAAGVTITGAAIRKAFADKTSGVYVATDERKSIPSDSTISRCIDIATMHTAARLTSFTAAGNAPKLTDYVVWLKLAAGVSLGNVSKIDVAATMVDGKPAKLVRTPATPRTPAAGPVTTSQLETVPTWGQVEMADDATLAEYAAAYDVSKIPADKREMLARAIVASIVIGQRAERGSDLLAGVI